MQNRTINAAAESTGVAGSGTGGVVVGVVNVVLFQEANRISNIAPGAMEPPLHE